MKPTLALSFLVAVIGATSACTSVPAAARGPDIAASRISSTVLPPIPLWPRGAPGVPGALGAAPEDTPEITAHFPPAGRANGAAMLIFPGGGYQHLSTVKEGSDVAEWLAGLGVTSFVVRYRLGPRYHHPVQLDDARRAMRTVRARADEWHLDKTRVGVIGFSAGGHLASTVGTHFDAGVQASADPLERESSRPDFMLLIYPVITMRDTIGHRGSRVNLLGEAPPPALVRLLSSEMQVTPATPPAFIVHSIDDRTVPVENAQLFLESLRRAAVPAELHLFDHGGHGYGLAPADPALAAWTTLAEGWMRRHGWLVSRGQ